MHNLKRDLKEFGLLHAFVIGLICAVFVIAAVPKMVDNVSLTQIASPDYSNPFENYGQ